VLDLQSFAEELLAMKCNDLLNESAEQIVSK